MLERDMLNLLLGRLGNARRRLNHYDDYLEGEQPLQFIAPALKKELGNRLTQLVINYPQLGVEAYENRLDVEGFRFSADVSGDNDLWQVWQANDGDLLSQQVHYESLGLGRSYVIVGAGQNPGDPPVITGESPFQVIHIVDPRTRRPAAAVKEWTDLEQVHWANLYLPDSRITYRMNAGLWVEDQRDDHQMGLVQVVPQTNRPRMLAGLGRRRNRLRPIGMAEFHSIIPISDAANKMATDMMTSGEFHAMPRRWAFGLDPKDFVDDNGKPLDTWSMIAGRLWASKNKDVKVGQFPESDLANFHSTIKLLAQIISQLLALPPHYLGFVGDNPASADAIRSSEAQLVKRVERKQSILAAGWEAVQRLVLLTMTGRDDPKARMIETVWRDPSTPTVAQKTDAAVKLYQSGVVPRRQLWEDLGYSPAQQDRMALWMRQEAAEAAYDPQVQALIAKDGGDGAVPGSGDPVPQDADAPLPGGAPARTPGVGQS